MARSRSARGVYALGAIAVLLLAQHGIAQMNDAQGFDGTAGTPSPCRRAPFRIGASMADARTLTCSETGPEVTAERAAS